MTITVTPVTLTALTTATVDGAGVLDVLMKTMAAHLDVEYAKNRLRGPEYATVYLGSLEAVMQTAVQFLLQRDKATLEAEVIKQQHLLLTQQTANAVLEGAVLVAQECKLRAEYDVLLATKAKTEEELLLLTWKVATEKAQTTLLGVDDDSVIGRQKSLYIAQRDGFTRDAEQKGAKLLIDTWNVRRTTDEGTVADGTNKLADESIGRVVTKLLAGINA